MNSIQKAKRIQKHMPGNRNIYWDTKFQCFRVMSPFSPSLTRNNHYELVN